MQTFFNSEHFLLSQRLLRQMTWWRHQMKTFSALLTICAGNSTVPGEFPTQRPVTRSFDVSFDLRPNKRLSTKSWGWWFETPSCSSWRHRNGMTHIWRKCCIFHWIWGNKTKRKNKILLSIHHFTYRNLHKTDLIHNYSWNEICVQRREHRGCFKYMPVKIKYNQGLLCITFGLIISPLLTHIPSSAAYVRQWTGSALVKILTCRPFGAKSLSKSVLGYCQLGSEISIKNSKLFIHENVSENIFCEMAGGKGDK